MREKQYDDVILEDLSNEQKLLKNQIDASQEKGKRQELRKNRSKIMKQIQKRIRILQNEKMNQQLAEIERKKDDSNKCYQAIRTLNNRKPKKSLIVQGEDGSIAGSEKEQITLITEHFKNMFTMETKELLPTIPPCEMKTSFTGAEIQKAAESLKSRKSVGDDNLNAEFIKYGPPEIHEGVAKLLNDMASTGEYPEQIKQGILKPLQKPGKKPGPPSNLRPIILLSVLRKLLAICMIRRCWDRISTKIPIRQAAYQAGRSTTEQVFAIKMLAEKAITSSTYNIYLLLLDMSKAFDTVSRGKLLKDLKEILQPDELHMMSLLIKDVNLRVKVGKEKGENIKTEIGIAQGDCLSAVLFIFYLARSMNTENAATDPSRKNNYFEINPQYADDITWASTAKCRIDHIKETIPGKLEERNLQINESKTEEYNIEQKGNEAWKECKILGSLLDTEKDINRRKILAIDAYKTLNSIFSSKINSVTIKLRTFNAYVASVFLYNSELWTLTKKLENTIDTFQRRHLRKILGINWQRNITNNELYAKTKYEPWSEIIRERRLTWLGHLMRLHPETPARKALKEYLRKVKRPQGRPKTTWMQTIRQDLACVGIKLDLSKEAQTLNRLSELTQDRKNWRGIVKRVVQY